MAEGRFNALLVDATAKGDLSLHSRLEWAEDGTLRLLGFMGGKEPICGVCGEPIKWCLDMFSFTTSFDGPHKLAHARCVWTPEAFDRPHHRARDQRV